MDIITQNIYQLVLTFRNKLNSILGKNFSQIVSIILICGNSLLWMIHPFMKFKRIGYLTMFIAIVVAILSTEEKPRKFQINKSLLIPMLLLGFFYLASALLYSNRDRLVIGVYFILVLPFITRMISPKKNLGNFLFSFSIGSIGSFIILIILSVIYAPLLTERYSSILLNPNGLAFVLLPITISIFYLLIRVKDHPCKRIWHVVLFFLFGLNMAFLIFSSSRTGLLSVGIMLICFIIYLVIVKQKIITYILSIFLAILIGIPFTYFMLTTVNSQILEIRMMNSSKTIVFLSMDYEVLDNVEKEKTNSKDKNNGNKYEKNMTNLNEILEKVKESSSKGITDDRDISSGRFIIWKSFINSLNWVGHDPQDYIRIPERKLNTNDPHNMILKTGYDLGIGATFVTIIFFIFFAIFLLRKFIFCIHIKYMTREDIFLYLTSISFFIVGMFSTTFLPFTSILPTLFWVIVPVYEKEKNAS